MDSGSQESVIYVKKTGPLLLRMLFHGKTFCLCRRQLGLDCQHLILWDLDERTHQIVECQRREFCLLLFSWHFYSPSIVKLGELFQRPSSAVTSPLRKAFSIFFVSAGE